VGSKGQGQGPGLCIEDLQRAMQRALDALTEGLQGADRRYSGTLSLHPTLYTLHWDGD
jgi:hypothetical protein